MVITRIFLSTIDCIESVIKMNKKIIFALLGLCAGVFFLMTKKQSSKQIANPTLFADVLNQVKSMTAFGITNHNPLNIRYTANTAKNPWKGLIGKHTASSGDFCIFVDDLMGFRAGAYLLKNNYIGKGINTIASIITKWAPPNENKTKEYIQYVAKKMGKLEFTPLTVADIPAMLQAMAQVEVGKVYDMALIKKGVALA